MPEDQHPSEACAECNPPECDVTVCHQLAVTCIVGESGDLWLCSERAVPAGDGPDDDDYLDRPALGRTHPYGTRSV